MNDRALLVGKWIVFLAVITIYVCILVPGIFLSSALFLLIITLEFILKVIFFIPVFIIFGVSTFDKFEYEFKEYREPDQTSYLGSWFMSALMAFIFKERLIENFKKFMFND